VIDQRVSVVVLTHDRPAELRRTLRRLWQLPEQPHVIVVDNASVAGTVETVVRAFPNIELVRCDRNHGAAGRNEPLATAWREAQRIMREAALAGVLSKALQQTLPGLPWALLRRRAVPPEVDRMYRLVFAQRKSLRATLGPSSRI